MRRSLGSDILHEEHRIDGVRVVVMRKRESVPKLWHGQLPPRSPTVLFVPGGAFVTDFEAADLCFLYGWVRRAGATLVYVTYDFAPEAQFPTSMMQVCAAAAHLLTGRVCPPCHLVTSVCPPRNRQVATVYRALREGSHARTLGFRASPLVVAGLSAGGNLAISALIAPLLPPPRMPEGQPPLDSPPWCGMPDGLLLICPVLNLCRSASPSRVAFASDVLLPQPLLVAFGAAYGAKELREMADPAVSPALAPDDVLRRLPATCIQVGGFDPLLDDSVDFNTRIRRLGVAGELRIHRSLTHTFPSFPHLHVIPEVAEALDTTLEWIAGLFRRGERAKRAEPA